ncbi:MULTISPECIES: DsbA family protein [Sphingomonas]|uniref:DsbA family protein n=1 Tax=Sphingomonas TaxID=13687 RepID=UPI000DEFB7D0|nr:MULTISPECIES: thioredoxin domain-containing protein [Sphingomonas]
MRTSIALAATVLALSLPGLAACKKSSSSQTAAATTADQSLKITQSSPPPGGSWLDVVNTTQDGYVRGNPNAKVKLLEIASLGCPVCKRFADEGVPPLKELVKSGQVSWEIRPYIIHGPIDLAANLIARCNGPQGFFPLAEAMYKDQLSWMGTIEKLPPAELDQMQSLPAQQVVKQMAERSGLQTLAAQHGLPSGKSNQCLADQKALENEVAATARVTDQYPDFKGTPTFVLNGKLLDQTSNWNALKPQLEAALKS